ncbi:MAG: sensor histidine kinase [Thermoanaerobaculales bacterium]
MLDRIPVASWFPAQDPADCSLCRDARTALTPEALRVAGEIALAVTTRGHAAQLVEAVATRLGAAIGAGHATILVPAPGGMWRVLTSSDPADTHDLMVDTDRYPELLEVRRTGTPFIAPAVEAAPELELARPILLAAGVRCLAAYPIFVAPGSSDPVVLKISLQRPPEPSQLLLATLAAHLLVHRLGRPQQSRVAHQLGLTTPGDGEYDPTTVLRLLPLAAAVVDPSGKVLHANNRALWLLRDRWTSGGRGAITLHTRPERAWLSAASRWDAHVFTPNGELAALGWSSPVGTDRTLVLVEPHPEARRRSRERKMRLILAEKLKELEAANIRLEEYARLRGRFVSDAAHELKTPLAILRSYLEILLDDLTEGFSADQREFLRAAAHGAQRLQRLVEELLDLAALESGHLQIVLEQVSPQEAARAVVEELHPLAAQGDVGVHLEAAPTLALRGDPERLKQVLRNLVENGVKYTQPGGDVFVSFQRRGDRGLISVRDTGVGIAAEALPHIFEEFVRVPGRRPVDGAGLGLAIVRRLVQAMGGQVWAESRPGVGSQFFVELPVWTGQG